MRLIVQTADTLNRNLRSELWEYLNDRNFLRGADELSIVVHKINFLPVS